jgi:hypothetical protein
MMVALIVLAVVVLGLVLALAALLVPRRRAVKARRGTFRGRLRVLEGEVEGLSTGWRDGYGCWARDVLVWEEAPLFLRTRLIPVEGADASGIRTVANGGRNGLGRNPVAVRLLAGDRSRLELAISDDDRVKALGPFARTTAVGSLVTAGGAAGEREGQDE